MSAREQWFRVDLSRWQEARGDGDKARPRGKGRWVFVLGDPEADGVTLPTFVGSYRAAKKEAKRTARDLGVRTAVLLP